MLTLTKMYETFVSPEDKNIKAHVAKQCCSVWKAPVRQTVKVIPLILFNVY